MRWRQWNEIRWVSIYKRWAVGKMWQRNGVDEAQLLLPGQPQTDRPVVLSDTAGHRALVYETYHHTTADRNELVWIDSSRTPLMMSTYYLLTMPMSVKWFDGRALEMGDDERKKGILLCIVINLSRPYHRVPVRYSRCLHQCNEDRVWQIHHMRYRLQESSTGTFKRCPPQWPFKVNPFIRGVIALKVHHVRRASAWVSGSRL